MSEGPTLRVKNWREFQHYTNRRPPWIKLHVTLLDDYEFQCLPLASRALAPMLWLLASQNVEGSIPANPALLAFRLRWDVKDIKAGLTPLIEKGFLIDASNVLATCLQSATSETETETETETELCPAADGVTDVFDHWKAEHNHPKAKLDEKRRKLIRNALKNYSADDLKRCITGYKNSPHHMGQNDRQTVYDDIEIFLRDAKHIDAGLKIAGATRWQ